MQNKEELREERENFREIRDDFDDNLSEKKLVEEGFED